MWLLDLDNTLHDSVAHLMPRINRDMTAFMMRELVLPEREAAELRVRWWRRYGATLLGLAAHHPQVDLHRFLAESHRFPDMDRLVRRRASLVAALRRLPGRRILFTNAPRRYAHDVARCLGLLPHLDAIVPIEAMRFAGRWQPKPSAASLRRTLARLRTRPTDAILVEDSPENLAAARRVGLRTVLVSGFSWGTAAAAAVRRARPHAGPGRVIDRRLHSVLALPRLRWRA